MRQSTTINSCVITNFFFFNDTATTEIYTLSLHDALPICRLHRLGAHPPAPRQRRPARRPPPRPGRPAQGAPGGLNRCRSEEHTSELQSRQYLVCRLLLEKKKITHLQPHTSFFPMIDFRLP